MNTTASPFAKVRSVGMDEVHWTHGFWADRFELCRTRMIPGMDRLMEGTNYSQFYYNFKIAAGLTNGEPHGATFNDGDFYKFLEGASATLVVTNDPNLRQTLDRIISVIGKAQETNGYLDTWVQLHIRDGDTNVVPFGEPGHFEVYNLGQLMTAACIHYRATGETNFLNIARRAADHLCEVFQHPTPALANNLVCPSHYMGLIELYRATRERRYLDLAKNLLAMRNLVEDGTADNQDQISFEQQTEAEGHAVRANYLYAGAADLFLETGNTNLWRPLETIWTNVVTKKMYITGGCGALYDGAAPYGSRDQKDITRVHQAYGYNYQLPNITAHNETCANIGNALWNWRMFLATGEAKFMDVVELELYNAVLSGVSLGGTNFFYTNPLRVTDPLPVKLRWPRTRTPFLSSFCCPPNLVRTIAESADYAYAKSADAIWVNLYGGSVMDTRLADGERVKLMQQTDYPWNGRVRIRIEECGSKPFALKLRIPGWADGASVRINDKPSMPVEVGNFATSPLNGERAGGRGGQSQEQSNANSTANEPFHPSPSIPLPVEGRGRSQTERGGEPIAQHGYVIISRVWHPGDFVDLNLPMPARLMQANPLVEEDVNQVAIQRGPVVYCLESPDLPSGVRLSDVLIPPDMSLTARYDRRLLDGIVVLEGGALVRSHENWSDKLYRAFQPSDLKSIPVKFIPYSVWQNRGPSEMSVWLPLAGQ